jgi:hypothetical protein
MLNGSFIAFADDFGATAGAAGLFAAGDCFMAGAGADFVGVCALATDVVKITAAAMEITERVETILRLIIRMAMPPCKMASGYYVRRDSDATCKVK